MDSFNGQINISRDLRQNKQTVIGKRDITDIIFLISGVGIACLIAYLFGYVFKLIDEFAVIFISIIPLSIIMLLGFRRKAGMRYFYYLIMSIISKCTKVRSNKSRIIDVLERQRLLIDKKIKKNVVADKIILVLLINRNDVYKASKIYLDNELVSRIQIRLTQKECFLLLEINYSYNDFLKEYTNNELKAVVVKTGQKKSIKSIVMRFKEKTYYRICIKRRYYNKYARFVNLSAFNNDFMPQVISEFKENLEKNKVVFKTINEEFVSNLKTKNKKVWGLHLYDNIDYKNIVDEACNNSEVVIYILKYNGRVYLSTFFIMDTDKEVKISKNIVLNKYKDDQKIAMSQCTFYMINPYNNFRCYEG